jgi:hypothetical protein
MIGGIDIAIPTNCGASSVEVAVRAIRQKWPRSVFENGTNGDRYDRFSEIPFGLIEELFVYRDRASADVWDAEGAIPSVYNTMIHLIADDDLLTVVVDEKDAEMGEIVGAISSGLDDGVHYIPAEAA